MTHDFAGSPVALTGPALGHWNATVRGFLAHSATTPDHLANLLAAAPDFALGHALRGHFCVLLGRREMMETARVSAEEARRLIAAAGADSRTCRMLAALDAMLARQPRLAISEIEQILMADPRDSLAMKLSHAIRFLIGDAAGMRRSVERVLAAHGADHPARGYALGCHAFTLEETGAYAAAERAGMQGLELAADDAWGLHAVAHVHDMTARPDDGIALIDGNRAAWSGSNNFRFHVWWHKALLHLDRGEFDAALALYDAEVRNQQTDDYRDIANATSLLMRLDLEDVQTGDRWEELAALAEGRTEDGCLAFADLHYMLALMGGNRNEAAVRLRAGMARQAAAGDGLAPVAAGPGQAAMAGVWAFRQGRYDLAFAQLETARGLLYTIGGSHAQRDVFDRIAVEAGLRAGLLDRTETLLRDRTARRGGHLDRFAISRLSRIDDARRLAFSATAK